MADADANADICTALVRDRDRDRYVSALFAPPERRRALIALDAFTIEIVQVRALAREALPGEIRLQWWRDVLAGIAHGSVEANPVAAELAAAIAAYDLPVTALERLIEAHRFDLYDEPMATMTEFDSYLVDTAGVRFALARRILGDAAQEPDALSRQAGRAYGMTAILMRLGVHASRRQLYLPADRLARFGVAAEDIFAGHVTAPLRALIAAFAGEALAALGEADAQAAKLSAAERPALLPLAALKPALAQFLRSDVDPFRPREISPLRRLWRIWRATRL
ncbi:MAG: phytoene/squalene synthase family protein [Xanthobacteraceae bacterium]|nr:MAG: phytoene/squalene synthase family protein [Xanthobacteraceae bacterium]